MWEVTTGRLLTDNIKKVMIYKVWVFWPLVWTFLGVSDERDQFGSAFF